MYGYIKIDSGTAPSQQILGLGIPRKMIRSIPKRETLLSIEF